MFSICKRFCVPKCFGIFANYVITQNQFRTFIKYRKLEMCEHVSCGVLAQVNRCAMEQEHRTDLVFFDKFGR